MIARLEWINPLEEEAARKTISSSRRKGGSRAKVKKTELPKWLTEAEATTPGMKGMPGEMPSWYYPTFVPPQTGGSIRRIGNKRIDITTKTEGIDIPVPQEDRLNAEQSKISLELDRKRNLSPRERADEDLADTQPGSELKPGSEKKQEIKPVEGSTGRYKQKSIQLQGKEIAKQASTKPKPAETGWSTVFTKDPKTGEELGVMTRNQRKEWERANPKANPKWDAAYTPKSEVKQTPKVIKEKKQQTDEIIENIKDKDKQSKKSTKDNLIDIDYGNMAAKAIGGKDGAAIYNLAKALANYKKTAAASSTASAAGPVAMAALAINKGLTDPELLVTRNVGRASEQPRIEDIMFGTDNIYDAWG